MQTAVKYMTEFVDLESTQAIQLTDTFSESMFNVARNNCLHMHADDDNNKITIILS